jgi:hypothetical protein
MLSIKNIAFADDDSDHKEFLCEAVKVYALMFSLLAQTTVLPYLIS